MEYIIFFYEKDFHAVQWPRATHGSVLQSKISAMEYEGNYGSSLQYAWYGGSYPWKIELVNLGNVIPLNTFGGNSYWLSRGLRRYVSEKWIVWLKLFRQPQRRKENF